MAIDRKKPVAFDEVEESTEIEAEPMPVEAEVESHEPAAETATLSLEMLGGQKVSPGDTVRLEVVEVSDEDGTVTVKYSNPKNGGIAKAAAVFNEGV